MVVPVFLSSAARDHDALPAAMIKIVLLCAFLAVAAAQFITPYYGSSYISPLYRSGLYSGYSLPYAYNYNYGYGLGGLGYGYNYNYLYR